MWLMITNLGHQWLSRHELRCAAKDRLHRYLWYFGRGVPSYLSPSLVLLCEYHRHRLIAASVKY
jgi:hypothetical protein